MVLRDAAAIPLVGLGEFGEFAEVFAKRRVSLHAALTNDMLALSLVWSSFVVAIGRRLGQLRRRGGMPGHGGWPFGLRMSVG